MARKKRIKHVRIVRSLGKSWGSGLQRLLMTHAAAQARAFLKAGARVGEDTVEVKIPLSVHIAFPRKGKGIAADGGVLRCNCVFIEDPNGSTVCICRGPDAADCDCLIVV